MGILCNRPIWFKVSKRKLKRICSRCNKSIRTTTFYYQQKPFMMYCWSCFFQECKIIEHDNHKPHKTTQNKREVYQEQAGNPDIRELIYKLDQKKKELKLLL